MKWEELLRRDDIVGGDFEKASTGVKGRIVVRGPISAIGRESEDTITITCAWLAERQKDGKWEKAPDFSRTFSLERRYYEELEETDVRTIKIWAPRTSSVISFTFFLRGGEKLISAEVQGLTPEDLEAEKAITVAAD